jgi:two-component system sensor histidine kinase UhpB
LVETWQSRHEAIALTMNIRDIPKSFDEAAEVTSYRLLQECLTNISRHAAATSVEIQVEAVPRGVQTGLAIKVRDDGKGFEASRVEGLGLPGMRERVEGLGGELMLRTSPGLGTEIQAWIPTKITS